MEEKKKFKLVSSKKTRYLLPNILTLAGVCLGISSIKFSIDENFSLAVTLILLAAILDALDGRIARLTNTQTSFGEYFDSLSDMVCFGLSPAILVYMWSASLFDLQTWQTNKLPWIICFVYVASAAIRLARFNSKSQTIDKKYFIDFNSQTFGSGEKDYTNKVFLESNYFQGLLNFESHWNDAQISHNLYWSQPSEYDPAFDTLINFFHKEKIGPLPIRL